MAIPFRFETVQRVREAERDRSRLTLALEQQRETALSLKRRQIFAERTAAQQELRALQDGPDWSADQGLARRRHVERLTQELEQIDAELQIVAASLARCRHELLEADTAVKGLEKLADRHAVQQRRGEQKSADRDREDSWRAA